LVELDSQYDRLLDEVKDYVNHPDWIEYDKEIQHAIQEIQQE
jgi:hypothetical protein